MQINDVIDYFNDSVVETKENIKENIIRLKDFSIDAYNSLKDDINNEKSIINDDIFLTLDQKIKEIEGNKNILKKNADKYLEINSNFENIKKFINQIYSDIFTNLDIQLSLPTYYQIKENISNSIVHPILKDDINKKICLNVEVARKSINQIDYEMSQLLPSNISNKINNNKLTSLNIENNPFYHTPNNSFYDIINKFQTEKNQNTGNYNINQGINTIQDNSKSITQSKINNFSQKYQNIIGFTENFAKTIINTDSKNSIIDEAIELNEINSKTTEKRNPKIKGGIFI